MMPPFILDIFWKGITTTFLIFLEVCIMENLRVKKCNQGSGGNRENGQTKKEAKKEELKSK